MLGQVVPLAVPGKGRTIPTEGAANNGPVLYASRGQCRPFGATPRADGVNFAIFSRHAHSVYLILFEEGHDEPFAEIGLDPSRNKTGDVWHIFVHNLPAGGLSAYPANAP